MKHPIDWTHALFALAGLAGFGLLSADQVSGTRTQDQGQQLQPLGLTAEHLEILNHMSIVYPDSCPSGTGPKTLRISGINVQIVNGLGATNGDPLDPNAVDGPGLMTNGLGNLIVGYNECGNPFSDDRSGSHNVVIGQRHSYSSFGGLVVGRRNLTSGPYAVVSAGSRNQATNLDSSISGGNTGIASGVGSSVNGGLVSEASGDYSVIVGGEQNVASGLASVAVGGEENGAHGAYSVVVGGQLSDALGMWSVFGGGYDRCVTGPHDWRAGTLFEDF